MPSLLSRLGNGVKAFGRAVRGFPLPDHQWFDFHGIPHPFKPKESLDAYGDNVWLYAAVSKIAQEIGRTRFRLRTQRKDGEFEYIVKHDVLDLLARPQPNKAGKSSLTGFKLKYVLGMHLGLNGEGWWVAQDRRKVNGTPTRLDPLIPGYVFVKTDPITGDLAKYVYRLPDREIEIDPVDVIQFSIPDPKNWNRGHSPVQSVRWAVDTYAEAEKMNLHGLRNKAVPGGVLQTTAERLPTEEIKRLRDEWNQRYGGSDNANKVAILTKGLTFNPTQMTPAEMEFIAGKEMNRDEILANYSIGLEMLGKTESQTRANAETAVYIFMRFGVLFFLENILDTLNNDLLPLFPGTENMEFCFDDPVPENMEEKRLNSQALMDSGALTPDEMRQQFGLEPLKIKGVTDVPYVNFSRIAAGTAPPDPLG